MKTAYICSPLLGDVIHNIERAKHYGRLTLKLEVTPVIPHIYAELMPVDNEELLQNAGRSVLFLCDELWVFGNVWTERMKKEIKTAKAINLRIRYFSDADIKKMEEDN